jgi:hypothetical protein
MRYETVELVEQLEELRKLLEKVPQLGFDDFECLSRDIALGNRTTAIGADGVREIFIRLRLGVGYEKLMAALRTGEIAKVAHAISELRSAGYAAPA